MEEQNPIKIRMLAYLADFFLVLMLAAMSAIPFTLTLAFIPGMEESQEIIPLFAQLSMIILPVPYFVLLEKYLATTPGKKLFELEVNTVTESELTFTQSIIRNITKIRPEILVLDLIIGYFINSSRKQRLTEIMSKTSVNTLEVKPHYTVGGRKTIRAFKVVLSICGIFFLAILIIADILMFIP